MEILIPHGLPHQAQTFELMQCAPPSALITLISRAKTRSCTAQFDASPRSLPHSAWLAHQFGLTANIESRNSPPVASALMQRYDLKPDDGFWFVVNPVHLEVGMSQIVLTDPSCLSLDEAEAHALFDAAKPVFDDAGMELRYGDTETWFIRADNWQTLRTAMPEAATGRDIRNWQPEGATELAWHRLQNEVQMCWHAHPANLRRTENGKPGINSLWLWGGGPTTLTKLPQTAPYTMTYRLSGWMGALTQRSTLNWTDCSVDDIITSPPEHGLLLLEELMPSALTLDWPAWLNTWQEIDDNWLTPLIKAIKDRQMERLTLHLGHDTRLISFVLDRTSLRKFWIKKNLGPLFI